jgi:hypothetical protein
LILGPIVEETSVAVMVFVVMESSVSNRQ